MQQQTPKFQWKALYSAFRLALRDEPPEGHSYVHADVAAVRAAADAVAADRVRAGFALRHAGKLPRVWRDAGVVPRVMDPGLEARLWWARECPELPFELPVEAAA
jgi:hypothetical protein